MTQILILIAHPNLDMVDEIKATLSARFEAEPGPRPIFTFERNSERALRALEPEPAHLVVVDLDLPTNRSSGPVPFGGLRFAEAAHARYPDLPLVFIAASTGTELASKIDSIGKAALVREGQTFDIDLQDQVLQALGGAAAMLAATQAVEPAALNPAADPTGFAKRAIEAPVRYLIEFYLREDGDCTYRARSFNAPNPYEYQLPFQVDPLELAKLREATARLPDSSDWHDGYEKIGERLCLLLLESNTQIIRDLGRLDERAAQHAGSQVAICFVVDQGVYPIALEALRDAAGPNPKYWLERAPLWRKLDMPSRQPGLFQDSETRDGPIDCLIVAADAHGRVDGWNACFEALAGVEVEVRQLANDLREQTSVRIGRIGVIWIKDGQVLTRGIDADCQSDGDPQAGSFVEVLEQLLTKRGPWHLVHYAGHTYYDEQFKRGYLVLPGAMAKPDEGAALEPVGTSRFASWLSQTRLVYMSSCRGSSQAFVYNLCEYNVAAVTGFRWNINDDIACIHSRRFYGELFKQRSIEGAVQGTWNFMFDRYLEDRVWISSELVMQLAA